MADSLYTAYALSVLAGVAAAVALAVAGLLLSRLFRRVPAGKAPEPEPGPVPDTEGSAITQPLAQQADFAIEQEIICIHSEEQIP